MTDAPPHLDDVFPGSVDRSAGDQAARAGQQGVGYAPRLVDALARLAAAEPLARKLVVAPTLGSARELLRLVGRTEGGWLGFEITTPGPLATRLARPALDRAGLFAMDAFERQAILDEALDSALASERGGLGRLSEGVGFRERVHGAIDALRLGGLGPSQLEAARIGDFRKRLLLLRVLQRYERLLVQRRRVDPAGILGMALGALDDGGASMPTAVGADRVLLVPGLGTRGLQGRFLGALSARGATVLETDPVMGLEVPDAVLWNRSEIGSPFAYLYASEGAPADDTVDVEMFRAASVKDELREVCRRVVEAGLRWDQVEIVTPDPLAYGSALHAISADLGIPVTYAVGLPIARTRTGRVVRAYLDWVEDGFPADAIRRLLEAGDLRPTRSGRGHSASALARRFRALRVGWGRRRYRSQIRSAEAAVDGLERGRWETEEGFEARRERVRGELAALKSILFPTLRATPAVPDRLGEPGDPVSPAELAGGLRAFLRRVPRGSGPDADARERVARVLERVEATLRRKTDFRAAVTILRRHLDLRVRPAPTADRIGRSPWSSEGGHLHLADMEHGGFSGREAHFLVGFDADRFPGTGGQDPVLLDSDRRILSPELPTSTELIQERRFAFASLVSRLRGAVTISYSAWDPTQARSVGPSTALLSLLRLSRRAAGLTFRDLEATLGRVVCAVPAADRLALDRDDVWLSALSDGEVMRQGEAAVRAGFRSLDIGLNARTARAVGVPGPHHGVVVSRPGDFDPRVNRELVLSASRLEKLGACPLHYLHSSVLRLVPPDDPEFDPDRWLDPRRRGGLLHSVFERALSGARERGMEVSDPGFESFALGCLEAELESARDQIPVPGEGALVRESTGLAEDVRSFVRMVRERGAPWVRLEFAFGLGDEAVEVDVPGGAIRLRGVIDRIDDHGIEGIHVVDYKTGVARGYAKGSVFAGGRRLQHALYAHAVEETLGGQVVFGEYHFPTRRGENERVRYERGRIAAATELVSVMLDGVSAGHFVPTDEPDDCKFCDFSAICRVRGADWGTPDSPLAEWSSEHANVGMAPELAALKRTRSFD